jgi:hypothetical protein
MAQAATKKAEKMAAAAKKKSAEKEAAKKKKEAAAAAAKRNAEEVWSRLCTKHVCAKLAVHVGQCTVVALDTF